MNPLLLTKDSSYPHGAYIQLYTPRQYIFVLQEGGLPEPGTVLC